MLEALLVDREQRQCNGVIEGLTRPIPARGRQGEHAPPFSPSTFSLLSYFSHLPTLCTLVLALSVHPTPQQVRSQRQHSTKHD